MQPGDRVYYLYTGKDGTPIKYAAIVLAIEDEGILIRVGKYDVQSQEVKTLESVVAATALQPRSMPCSYKDKLTDSA